MTSGDVELFPVAAYGKGVALLSIAQRATQDGKIGLAYKILRHGLNEFSQPESAATVCLQKLKGDFYSFGATLPPSVFLDSTKYNNSSDSDGFLEKMEFISQGEAAYRCAHALIEGCSDESSALRAQLLTDIGSNYLLQAQIASGHESEGLGGRVSDVSSELFASAAKEFRLALEISPLFGLAWCGLGCALVRSDPLMAQHAFSRSMELDKLAPDSYANLSFLYTTHKNHGASALVSDALTEIADTPMMWINRALIFEYTASQQAEHMLECKYLKQAADAYRASMQTLKHPSATLGISLTCRIESNESDDMLMDSYNYASEYIGRVGSADLPAMLAEGVLSVEVAAKSTNDRFDQMLIEARQLLLHRIERVEECSMDNTEDQGIDLSLCRELVTKDVKNNEQQATDSKSVGSEWSIHRQVVNSPNRGDLWLRLAKQCALKASDEKEGSTGTALTAARRATSILMQQLAEPTTIPTKDRSTRVVKARDLSDALALRYWLEHISDSRKCGIPCDAEDLLPTIQAVNTLELQRSLIICPGNIMARQALLESIVK